jgi:hypothetical protein
LVLLFGFEKKDREAIDARELAALQTITAALLAMEPKIRPSSRASLRRSIVKKSRLLDEMRETARGLERIEVLDKQTMREFDVLTLPAVKELSAK